MGVGDGSGVGYTAVPGGRGQGAAAPEVEVKAPREASLAWFLLFSPHPLSCCGTRGGVCLNFDLSPISWPLKP